jgi:hypothetical protein
LTYSRIHAIIATEYITINIMMPSSELFGNTDEALEKGFNVSAQTLEINGEEISLALENQGDCSLSKSTEDGVTTIRLSWEGAAEISFRYEEGSSLVCSQVTTIGTTYPSTIPLRDGESAGDAIARTLKGFLDAPVWDAAEPENPSEGRLNNILKNPERGNHFTYHETEVAEPHIVQAALDTGLVPPSVSFTRTCIILGQTEDRVLVYDVASNALQQVGGHSTYFNYEAQRRTETDLTHSLTLEEFQRRYSLDSGITIIADSADEGPHQHTNRISDFLVGQWTENGEITEEDEAKDEVLMHASMAIHGRITNVLKLFPHKDGQYEERFAKGQAAMSQDPEFVAEIGALFAAKDEQFRPTVEAWCAANLDFWGTTE